VGREVAEKLPFFFVLSRNVKQKRQNVKQKRQAETSKRQAETSSRNVKQKIKKHFIYKFKNRNKTNSESFKL